MTDRELEIFLHALQPRRLPPRVLAIPATEAVATETAGGLLRFLGGWRGWSCAAIFAAGLVASRLLGPVGDGGALPGRPTASIVVQGGDLDYVTLPDGSSARRYRIRSLETVSWIDPRTKASLRWTLPREDVRVVPVRAY